MGKRRHVRAKSKLKFGKKKLRESRGHGKGEFKGEDDEACEWRKQKRNESIWKRWLAFFRGHWTLNATRDMGNAMAPVPKDARARPAKGDEFAWQLPPEEGAAEAATENDGNLSATYRLKADAHDVREVHKAHEGKAPAQQREELRDACLEDCKVCSHFPESRHGHRSSAPGPAHNVLTSALFVREYAKTVRGSTDSEDFTFSSSDLNAETLGDRINLGVGEEKEKGQEERAEFLKKDLRKETDNNAIKTISEPSWNEKNKLFQREKLQENLNDLIKQFVFLETDSLLGSYHSDLTSRSQLESKLKEEKARVMSNSREFSDSFPITINAFADNDDDDDDDDDDDGDDDDDDDDDDEDDDGNDGNDEEVTLRTEGLREVSPEILVNIKPFKEYMWKVDEVYGENSKIQPEDTKSVRTLRKRRKTSEMGETVGHKHNFRVCKKSKMGKGSETTSRKGIIGFQLNVYSLDETNADEYVAKSAQELRTRGGRSKKTAGTASEGFLICESDADADAEVDLLHDPLSCSIRGVYRSYADIAESPVYDKDESWEHVLDHFDDRNHNVIFRQNLNQFKTLIKCDVGSGPQATRPAHPETVPLTSRGRQVKQECKIRTNGETEEELEYDEEKHFMGREPQRTGSAEKKGLPRRRLVILTRGTPASVCCGKRFFETFSLSLAGSGWMSFGAVATRTEMLCLKKWGFPREVITLTETNFSVLVERRHPRLCSSHLVIVSKTEKPEFKSQESSTSSLEVEAFGNPTNTAFTRGDAAEPAETENRATFRRENTLEYSPEDCPVVVKVPDTLSLNRKLFLRSTGCFYLTDFERAPQEKVAFSLDPVLEKVFCSTTRPEDVAHHAISLIFVEVVHRTLQILDVRINSFIVEVHDPDIASAFLSPATVRGMSETEFIRNHPSKAKIFPSSSETFASGRRKEVCEYGPLVQAKDNVACTGNGKGEFTGRGITSEFPKENVTRKLDPSCDKDGERFARKMMCIREADAMEKDGFEILYNGLFKKCLDECDDGQAAGPNFGKDNSFDYGSVASRFFGKETDGFHRLALLPVGNAGQKREGDRFVLPQVRLLESLEKATPGTFVKYKSSSSPVETVIPLEYRLKRFLHLTNESDEAACRGSTSENRHGEKASVRMRKTESISTGNDKIHVGSVLASGSDTRNKGAVDRRRSEDLPSPTRTESGPGSKIVEQGLTVLQEPAKTFVFEKSRRDVAKEVAAALNSIRDFGRCREDFARGTKRMSLVILLSKNK